MMFCSFLSGRFGDVEVQQYTKRNESAWVCVAMGEASESAKKD